jgi:hypothetical protein
MRRLVIMLAPVVACESFVAGTTPAAGPDGGTLREGASSPDAGTGSADSGAQKDYALQMNGDDYVDVPDLELTQDFTLEAWIRPAANDLAREQDIVSKDRNSDSSTQCRLVLRADNSIYFNAADASGSSHGLTDSGTVRKLASAAIDLERWTHVAVTKHGTTVTLLIDGKTVSQVPLTSDFAIPVNRDVHFRIGARYAAGSDAADSTFLGAVDDVRVWNLARTEAEIQAAMKTVPPPSTTGLVALFPFAEGMGTTSASATGKYPATLVGGVWVPR